MSFEYNGVVYRDLEPQVRYDAEQVQLLKQADVTINENLQTVNESLQTVNTEINNKLTKPTNPSAESAVTMLADGTVGTKPLSEIGGGGKLYRHSIFAFWSDITTNIRLDILKSSITQISQGEFQTYATSFPIVSVAGPTGSGICTIYYDDHDNMYSLTAVVADIRNTNAPQILKLNKGAFDSFTDTVTEL